MRHPRTGLGVALFVLLAGCGGSTAAERIDELLLDGGSFLHQELPSPARRAALALPGSAPIDAGTTTAGALRETTAGRALLDAGPKVVPELISLLDDHKRRTLAAVVLAEIGGPEAARALLARWRTLRTTRRKVSVYRQRADASPPSLDHLGYHYEGVPSEYYAEILMGLAYCGSPISDQIAADTDKALDESARLQKSGRPLRGEEKRAPDERKVWNEGAVETAVEGLEILGMLGAPEAETPIRRALASPVAACRWEAISMAYWLGDGARKILPDVAARLDDPQDREHAAREIHKILGMPDLPDDVDDADLSRDVEYLRSTLKGKGYLIR